MKRFLKDISVYGVLPIIGKFSGFFLIPIYTRVFSSFEFGIIELIFTLISFLSFFCTLEFYSSIGRYFYEMETLIKKKRLISTGFWLTVIATLFIITLSLLFKEKLIFHYLNNGDYTYHLNIGMIWLLFLSLSTYLGVIPRYEKRAKLFVLINTISLLVRIVATIILITVLKFGIIGVFYGHIIGTIFSTISYGIISSKYLSFSINLLDIKKITSFALPLVPGLLLIGLWNPLSRKIIAHFYSIETVGLLSFAIRITAIIMIVNLAIHRAWTPFLFENFKKESFRIEIKQISYFMGIVSISFAIFLTLVSPEIVRIIGTSEYERGTVLIGFLSFYGILQALRRIRGFAPLVLSKTYIISLSEGIGLLLGALLLIIFKEFLLIGIGLAFVIPNLIKYLILVHYTQKKFDISFSNKHEIVLIIMLIVSILSILLKFTFFYRLILLTMILIYFSYLLYSNYYSQRLNKCMK